MSFDTPCCMRMSVTTVVALGMLVGCASQRAATTQPQSTTIDEGSVQLARASVLVFDPPVASGQTPLDLSRWGREPAAFVAYDQTSVTYFSVGYQDREFVNRSGAFRWSFVQTVGVSRR